MVHGGRMQHQWRGMTERVWIMYVHNGGGRGGQGTLSVVDEWNSMFLCSL